MMPDNMQEAKSVLDNVPKICSNCGQPLERHHGGLPCIGHRGFREGPQSPPAGMSHPPRLEITGHCPQCGAAIYGRKTKQPGEPAMTEYSCACWRKAGSRSIEQTAETK